MSRHVFVSASSNLLYSIVLIKVLYSLCNNVYSWQVFKGKQLHLHLQSSVHDQLAFLQLHLAWHHNLSHFFSHTSVTSLPQFLACVVSYWLCNPNRHPFLVAFIATGFWYIGLFCLLCCAFSLVAKTLG